MSLSPPLKTELMNIFFDESGQDSDRPSTMGGLLIPKSVYITTKMQELNKKLESGKIKLHWTEYSGHSELRENIKEAIYVFSEIARFTRMNVINYNRSTLDWRYKLSGDPASGKLDKREKQKHLNFATLMVYTKIPERIFYGLLRHFGKDIYIKTEIFIEKEGKYEKYDLEKRLQENLNTQSLYRSEQFWVTSCEMVTKGNMIGVELVDLLLGIIRLIINNKPLPPGLTMEEYAEQKIKGLYMKTQLVIELLKLPSFYAFISNIKYYEWDSHKELSEVSFKDYLDLFMANHFREFTS
ncbi:DUF3800 domain-containing protein (plasmid) [Bacillus sp. S3]|uniref:DUF3800 domain-containing protein n=1 Tax=Bacillus sp. S3 TaxID=486398 RepID=UPI00118A61FD|nr:DUF3800 domain-containing protein [Bacillus sp. S3]QCJ45524.1 DUF3800 domain-containing protein [Bacillus sp. S3]